MGALAAEGVRPPVEAAAAGETPDRTAAGTVGTDSTYDHLLPLLVEFAEPDMRDPRRSRVREELLCEFLPVAHHIARRYHGRGEPIADLSQVATIGLLGALERFDPHRGSAFLSFAVPTITGEIRRYFRDRTWSMRVPRALKELQGPVRDTTMMLSGPLGRAPRPSEIAAHLDVPTALVTTPSARRTPTPPPRSTPCPGRATVPWASTSATSTRRWS